LQRAELITTNETLGGLIRTRRTKNRWLDRETSAYHFGVIMTDHRTRRSTRDANRRSRVCGRGRESVSYLGALGRGSLLPLLQRGALRT
jgi:hypothetical protein